MGNAPNILPRLLDSLSSRPLFFIVSLHPQVEPLAQLVEEVCPAFVFAALYVQIGVITMLDFNFPTE